MKPKQSGILVCLVVAAMMFQYCSKSDTAAVAPTTPTLTQTVVTTVASPLLPGVPFNYSNAVFPAHIASVLPAVDNTPATNPITDNGATLGRVLFYDKNLSKSNTVSCASCHNPELSFSDSAVKSVGFAGGRTDRHSMPILNVRFYRSGKMFWDERANTLEEQVLQPIQNTTEMGMALAELQEKLPALSYYPALFEKAFGTTQVTADRISRALSQFVRSIVTCQSKYDQVKQGTATFTTDERDGETLFLTAGPNGGGTCAGCHAPPMFLTSNPAGPFALNDPLDLGINNQRRFKSSSLRNIANTAPYFHNGSIASLQNMLAGNIPAHSVGPQDRQKLLAFLLTLTDNVTIREEKFSNPFK